MNNNDRTMTAPNFELLFFVFNCKIKFRSDINQIYSKTYVHTFMSICV